ncbi:Uracil DNA glycosylase superfamily protein [Roseivivax jejudonensis]|uniref:Uracil DNA glycosylase superfamily protein n=1 Tax=Roseivivax jejudonensis TaxID=1529041 RepID=A0A1X6ZEV1_9RHOB|nr:uracil-DNA glycosylase family protein [Roseivivax jejudonensis]SLN49311.1 Uracil DNA glycosylase superfamily protein [Roseivivax jejudonensis]
MDPTAPLKAEIRACRICADRFAATRTAHAPRPCVWFSADAPILVAGQAPGMRVHESGKPFFDRSGDRLRDWMGIDESEFYDLAKVAVLPTAFCFPGYDAKGSDLPPPPVCWETWHHRALDAIGPVRLRLVIGGHAIRRHLGDRRPVREAVADWRARPPGTFALPHPSWRNTAFLRRNPWFEAEVVPRLRRAVADALDRPVRAAS